MLLVVIYMHTRFPCTHTHVRFTFPSTLPVAAASREAAEDSHSLAALLLRPPSSSSWPEAPPVFCWGQDALPPLLHLAASLSSPSSSSSSAGPRGAAALAGLRQRIVETLESVRVRAGSPVRVRAGIPVARPF